MYFFMRLSLIKKLQSQNYPFAIFFKKHYMLIVLTFDVPNFCINLLQISTSFIEIINWKVI